MLMREMLNKPISTWIKLYSMGSLLNAKELHQIVKGITNIYIYRKYTEQIKKAREDKLRRIE